MPDRLSRAYERVERLRGLLRGKMSLLIVMQDNPDPDAIASAAALRRLANQIAGTQCSIAYGGMIGRGENRAMVDYLSLNFRRFEDVSVERFERIAVVDTQPGAGNNALPAEIQPTIVLDHHPLQDQSRGLPFVDVRPRYGALATLLFEYLQAAEIADWLLRLERIQWSLCWGTYDEQLWLSLRTRNRKQHAGQLAERLVSDFGSGGGHAMSAGGQVPLDGIDRSAAEAALRDRLCESVGVADASDEALV
jgi:nanoRNase/pAp phosphatase (c-di-AMP/oligoRNAs hydrolase)